MNSHLAYLDFRHALRERRTWVAAALMIYAVVSLPFVVQQPPAHVQRAIASWLGEVDGFSVFMFVWIDLAMNKIVAFVPVVLASGVVLSERDTGQLAVLGAKPLRLEDYFLLRARSACLVMLTLHGFTTLLGLGWFSVRIASFRPVPYLWAMALHAFAAVFATALTATIAIAVGKRIPAALLSVSVLAAMVGLALIGFYQPSWRALSYLNPLTLGSLSLAHLDAPRPSTILPAMAALGTTTALLVLLGMRFARRAEEQS